MYRTAQFFGGFGAGAAAMYLLDPSRGHRRRTLARDKMFHIAREARDAVDVTSRDLAHRLQGFAAESKQLFYNLPVDDDVLVARIRSRLGRLVSHPGWIEVSARNAQITLSGRLSPIEASRLIEEVESMPGVSGVINRLEFDPSAGTREVREFEFLQHNWSPAARAIAILAGGGVFGFGIFSHGWFWRMTSGAGLPLLLRGLTNMELMRLMTLNFGRFETRKRARPAAAKKDGRSVGDVAPGLKRGSFKGSQQLPQAPEPLIESGPLLSEKPHIASYKSGKAG